ncbi:4-coumarate-CoA ligase-like 10-like, partial [Trifolium medium]|nr:4-coumarate-CoA ligase-like 10-like [Trifolium medium]
METATTLTGLLQAVAKKFPSRRAISVAGKLDLTHSHLNHLVESAANHLISAGIKPNDVVALTFPNTVEYVILFLAVIRVRATAAPLNAAYTSEEFEFYLSDSESKLLLTPLEGNEPAQAAATKLKIQLGSASLIKTTEEEETKFSFSISLNKPESESDLNSVNSVNSVSELINEPSDVALFLHTSGTTSRPKGVPLSQHNLVSSVRNIESVYRLSESDSTVIVLPLFHVHGLIAGLLSSLGAGGAVALPSAGRFSASTFWKDMIQYNATWYT